MSPRTLLRAYGVRHHRMVPHLAILLALQTTLIAIELLLPIFTKLMFDFVYRMQQFDAFTPIVVILMIFYIIQFILRGVSEFLALYSNQVMETHLRARVFSQIQSLEMRVFKSLSKGDLTLRLTEDVEKAVQLLLNQKLDLFSQLAQVSGILAICIWIHPPSFVLLLFSTSTYLLFSKYLFKNELGIVRDKLILQKSFIIESLNVFFRQFAVVKSFQTERKEEQNYLTLLNQENSLTIRDKILKIIYSMNGQLGFDLWLVFVTYYFGHSLMEGKITVGDLLALVLLLSQLRQPLIGLSQQFGRFRAGMASLRRINEFFTFHTERPALSVPLSTYDPASSQPVHIEVKQLGFSYTEIKSSSSEDTAHYSKLVFSNLNLDFEAGSYVTIVGENSSGKSTLLQLLNSNRNTYQGQILLDGAEMRSLSRTDLRRMIIAVNQEHGTFPGTLRENIAYGNPQATDQEIIEAAKSAALWDEIEKLPNGLNTVINTENEISRSEQQRLAIARAILLKPKVLLLDEVINDLDVMSDFLIQKSIRTMLKHCTVISAAQNISTLRNSDKIIFLKEGRVEEEGSFDKLMQNRGEFFKYYILNHGGFTEFKKQLEHEIERSSRHQTTFTLANFSVQDFSSQTSHLTPTLLQKLSTEILLTWVRCIRTSDTVIEYRKDLYLVLLPELKKEDTSHYIERMEKEMSSKVFTVGPHTFQFKFTGIAMTFDKAENRPRSIEEAIESALQPQIVATLEKLAS